MESKSKPEKARYPKLKNLDYDTFTSRGTTSDFDDRSFRVLGIDGEFDAIFQSLGLSGPDDFAIPAADWESMKLRSSWGKSFRDGELSDKFSENVRVTVSNVRGISGARPPVLTPPPWDIMRLFAPHGDENVNVRDYGDVDKESARISNENKLIGNVGDYDDMDNESYFSDEYDSSSITTYSSTTTVSRTTISSWQKGRLLGRGSLGSVYEGITDGGFFFAVKEISLLHQGRQSISQLEQEIHLLSKCEHENIVRYLGTEQTESNLYIFLELASKGSLLSLYQQYHFRDPLVSVYTRQILNGLKYLHDGNVVHRDIKCANILVDTNGTVKLADFGLAKSSKLNDVQSCKGTAFWMAPEVVNRSRSYGLAADIWSLGCTVLEILTGQHPYYPLDAMQAVYRIGNCIPPRVPEYISIEARDFILKCLQVNPSSRPTAAQLLNHPFVKKSFHYGEVVSAQGKSRPVISSWEKGKLLVLGLFGSVYEGSAEMEVLLDFHKSEGSLLDITDLFSLLENGVQYEFLKSKSVAVRSLKVISISNSQIPEIPDNLSFPDLEELYLHSNLHLSYIPPSFFKHMPALKVLDMSDTSIKNLAPPVFELFALEQLILRRCELLMELPPEISALTNLKVLDLEGTDLVCLPDELKELTNLKCLKISLYDAESYRKSKKIVSIIPAAVLSKLSRLKELSIVVDPQDVWCNAAMKAIIEDLPSLRKLKTLKLYLPTTELLNDLVELKWNNDDLPIYQNLSNFNFIIGPCSQHFISRLPSDLEEEFLKLKKCLKYINGEDITTQFAEALKHANALYLDRHWTMQNLSILKESNELKFCLLVDCNEMQVVFDGSDFNHRVANKGENLLSLQYLAIHYLKNLEVIWNGPGTGCCLRTLRVLVLHMCPNLTTVFTPVLLGDLHNLQEIIVEDCCKITNLIAEDSTQLTSKETLPGLKKLSLLYLPELVSISSGLSIGSELENLVIYDCPKLKRLPSLGMCNKDFIEIRGESEWWDALKWNTPEWDGGQPHYLRRAFSELDTDEDYLDEFALQYRNSLRLFVEECAAN
ncbi:uncharacterized protein LOC108218363 [Daucus carota subsp. sativus]|nr:PREDICTED: uncharacterized protein LOC108218363 [Daucus carota subsp. sativus]